MSHIRRIRRLSRSRQRNMSTRSTTTGPNPTPHISRHGSLPPNPTQTHQLHTSDYINSDDEDLFNSITDRIANQHQEHQANRSSPTSKSFIHSLQSLKFFDVFSSDSCPRTCSICRDDFEFFSEVNQLPCKHVFHPDCILPWLGRSNSCPLCRYKLPAEQNPKQLQSYVVRLGNVDLEGWGENQESGFHDALLRNAFVQARIRSVPSSRMGQIGSGLAVTGNSEDSVSSPLVQGESDPMVDEDGDTLMLDA